MASLSAVLNTLSGIERIRCMQLLKNPIWRPVAGSSLPDQRQLAYDRLKFIADNNMIDVGHFKDDPHRIFDIHELIGYVDGSTATKMTVQFNLFGGTLYNMVLPPESGFTKESLREKINSLEMMGCFGFTERGFGNNAFKMETTAKQTEDGNYVINSPTKNSVKSWITNSVCHANHAVIFAQILDVDDKPTGPRAFLVRIRDEDGEIVPGVTITDMGWKLGLNGVDNGTLHFHNVEVPKSHLLDAYVIDKGERKLVSTITNPRKKFLLMADQLLSGRVCISSMMLGCSKVLLQNTVHYAMNRRGVGKSGESDERIIFYGTQKSTIVPLLVNTIGLNLLLNRVKKAYADKSDDLVTLACIIKPLLAWHTQDMVTKCREMTGGEGFLEANQFGEGFAASQAGITAEGDSKVLCIKVASELTRHANKSDAYLHLLPYFSDYFTNIYNLNYRHHRLLYELMYITGMSGKDGYYDVWMKEHSDRVQQVAISYGEMMVQEELERYSNLPLVDDLHEYYTLSKLIEHADWYLANWMMTGWGYHSKKKRMKELEDNIINNIDNYIKDFNIPKDILHAPMGQYSWGE